MVLKSLLDGRPLLLVDQLPGGWLLVVSSAFGYLSSPSKSLFWVSSTDFSSGLINLEDVNIVKMIVAYSLFAGSMCKHSDVDLKQYGYEIHM